MEPGKSMTETGGHEGIQEVKVFGEASSKRFEIQSAILIAKQIPRDETQAFFALMKAAKRPSFAEDASYKFPRGDKSVTGPSVNLAREAARVWGNIRYGLEVLSDDEEERHVRGWGWDMQTNVKVEAEDRFRKLVQRKNAATKQTEWVKPDERDLRELTNRRGAILVRNCLLQLMPKDFIEDALFQCAETIKDTGAKDPDGARKRLVMDFSEFGITPEMIAERLGHALAEATVDELADLRQIYASIKDGQSSWKEYGKGGEQMPPAQSAASGSSGAGSYQPGFLPPWGSSPGLKIADVPMMTLRDYLTGLEHAMKDPRNDGQRATLEQYHKDILEAVNARIKEDAAGKTDKKGRNVDVDVKEKGKKKDDAPAAVPASAGGGEPPPPASEVALAEHTLVIEAIEPTDTTAAVKALQAAGADLRLTDPDWAKFEERFYKRFTQIKKKKV